MAPAKFKKTGKVENGRVMKNSAEGKSRGKAITAHNETRKIFIKLHVKERKQPSEELKVANKTSEASEPKEGPSVAGSTPATPDKLAGRDASDGRRSQDSAVTGDTGNGGATTPVRSPGSPVWVAVNSVKLREESRPAGEPRQAEEHGAGASVSPKITMGGKAGGGRPPINAVDQAVSPGPKPGNTAAGGAPGTAKSRKRKASVAENDEVNDADDDGDAVPRIRLKLTPPDKTAVGAKIPNTAEAIDRKDRLMIELHRRRAPWAEIVQRVAEITGHSYREGSLQGRLRNLRARFGAQLDQLVSPAVGRKVDVKGHNEERQPVQASKKRRRTVEEPSGGTPKEAAQAATPPPLSSSSSSLSLSSSLLLSSSPSSSSSSLARSPP